MSPDRREFLALGVGALTVAALPRAWRRPDALVRRSIPVMGTVAEVVVRHRDGAWAQRSIDAAFAELRRVDRTMTRFRDDSDVGRINRSPGEAVAVSDDTAVVLAAALAWRAASEGTFDPSAARGWSVGGGTPYEVDRGGSVARVRTAASGVRIDLGGIAKGHAVDLAARALRDRGVFHALVNAGGDLVALGVDGDGEPWKVGVRSPDAADGVARVLEVSDRAVATSGTYEQGPHILDPASGLPRPAATRSLTVEAATCLDADAAATAAFGLHAAEADRIVAAGAGSARVVHSI